MQSFSRLNSFNEATNPELHRSPVQLIMSVKTTEQRVRKMCGVVENRRHLLEKNVPLSVLYWIISMVFLFLPFRMTDRGISECDSLIVFLMVKLALFRQLPTPPADFDALLVAKRYVFCPRADYGLLSLRSRSWLESFQKQWWVRRWGLM